MHQLSIRSFAFAHLQQETYLLYLMLHFSFFDILNPSYADVFLLIQSHVERRDKIA